MRIEILMGALFASLAVGCVHRTIIAFEDHPTQPLTALQIMETKSYLVSSSTEHQFLTCSDTGNALVCKRQCGGDNDLVCPQGMTASWRSTNVR